MSAHVVSVNVGLPREVVWQGEVLRTGIFKEPVRGAVVIGTLNLEGDGQADLSVHGGTRKAVYAYPAEHYPWWRGELPDVEFTPGAFGENLTIAGLLEDGVCAADRLRVGAAELVVTQPRMPCFKLGLRFGRLDMPKRFLQSGRTGFYLAVARAGRVEAGDVVEIVERDPGAVSIAELVRLKRR
jgi:MOSC domain-containing protein YiiM